MTGIKIGVDKLHRMRVNVCGILPGNGVGYAKNTFYPGSGPEGGRYQAIAWPFQLPGRCGRRRQGRHRNGSCERPDLILCDTQLSSVDGYGVIHALQHYPETRGIPVVLLMSMAEKDSFREAM